MKLIIICLASIAVLVFVIIPAALGYWYMRQPDVEAFAIPIQFWIVPLVIVILYGISMASLID